CEQAPAGLTGWRRGGQVLGAGVHVAEEALEGPGPQRGRAGRGVDEQRDLLDRAGRVLEREPRGRVLIERELVAAPQRLLRVMPGLIDERARRAALGLVHRKIAEERVALAKA